MVGPDATKDAGRGISGSATLGGHELRDAFEAASRCLERHRDAINALNVFPVPDGDTGTNMFLTMRSVLEHSSAAGDPSAGGIAAAMSEGALLGARGNSGVILSQFFNGLAQGFHGKTEVAGNDLAQAFEMASRAAYASVSRPVDGTMLTVIRELSQAASRYAGSRGGYGDVLSVWGVALEAAKGALSRTPLQLPVLRQAGVVDAGGQGVVTLLEGAWRHLKGENVDTLELDLCAPVLEETADGLVGQLPIGSAPAVDEEFLTATEHELYGYCTQFVVHGEGLDPDAVRDHLSAMVDSTVVVGSDSLLRVHVHAHDPGPVVSYAVSLGSIAQVSIENMDQQHGEFIAGHRAGQADDPTGVGVAVATIPAGAEGGTQGTLGATIAVVPVIRGDGFEALFRGLGAPAVVTGGQTMNPSASELLEAARLTCAGDVIVLPNNPNIIPTAQQAAAIFNGDRAMVGLATTSSSKGPRLHVVPSRTIPQGVAAALAFNVESDLESNLDSMNRAIEAVKTVEVTRAVRPAIFGELQVAESQHIALVDGDLMAAEDEPLSALRAGLESALSPDHEVLTLYWGGEVEEDVASGVGERLRGMFPGLSVELVYGGQPLYSYVASLE